MVELNFQNNDQTRHWAHTRVTASQTFRVKNGRPVIHVDANVKGLAASAGNQVQHTWTHDPEDHTKFTLYAWKDDGAGGRIAATVEEELSVIAWTD